MKKKLLFILPALYSGGAERSLITLLTLLTQTDRYEIDLLLFRREGLFLPAVPAGVTVLDGGKKYAASMNCMNHGECNIKDNNFNGHFCIHFTNSRTHGSNKVDSDHQSAINTAYSRG